LKLKTYTVVFWLCIIFLYDPGGFFLGYFDGDLIGRIDFLDVLFFIAITVYYFSGIHKVISGDKYIKMYVGFIILWAIYFIFFFGLITPGSNKQDFIEFLIRTRYSYFTWLLILPVYKFTIISFKHFNSFLFITSFLILLLFFITIIYNVAIIPYFMNYRDYLGMDRYIMYGYGFIPLTIPIAITVFLYKSSIKNRGYYYFVGILAYMAWVVSLTRRHIIGNIIMFMVILLIINYIKGIKYTLKKSSIDLIILAILITLLFANQPTIYRTFQKSFSEAFKVITTAETSAGQSDNRLNLKNEFMLSIIKGNIFFGEGYQSHWFEGGANKTTYETSDYPFLASFAMLGLIGLIVFGYYYYFLIMILIKHFKYLKRNSISFLDNRYQLEIIYLIAIGSVMIFSLVNYTEYFSLTGIGEYNIHQILYVPFFLGIIYRLKILNENYSNSIY